MFDSLSDRLGNVFDKLRGRGALNEQDVRDAMREVRLALLEADVDFGVAKKFIAAVKERLVGLEIHKALNPTQQIVKIVNEELVTILGGETRRLRYAKSGPTVIMLAGLQGA